MEQNQFRIGGVYSNTNGYPTRLLRAGSKEGFACGCVVGCSEFCGQWSLTTGNWESSIGERTESCGWQDLIPGELTHIEGKGWVTVNERGEPIESSDGDDATWKAFNDVWDRHVAEIAERNRALFGLVKPTAAISKTPTLDALENTRDPKRATLPYFTERAQFDPFAGFITKSSTQHQELQRSFGRFVSPDMQDNGPQAAPGFGSAALVVRG